MRRLLSAAAAQNCSTYTYDANGNMVGDCRFNFEYGANNMLKRVRDATTNAVVEEYRYSPSGDRVKKVAYLSDGSNRTTLYISSGYEIELNESGAKQATNYVFANGERVAALYQNGSRTYFLNDHLGSSAVMVNGAGQLLDRESYYPYGAVKTGGSGSKYGYNSKEQDGTGLDYYGARYYNPQLKRWTQPDTIIQNPYDPQNLNRYSYVKNNPLKYTDPTGHYVESAIDVASLTWSLSDLRNDPSNPWNWAAAGADVVTLALPIVAAGGTGVRIAKNADKLDDVYDLAKNSDALQYFFKYSDNVAEAGAKGIPLGFKTEKQFEGAMSGIKIASGADDAIVGIRGSATTGVKYTDGTPFRFEGSKSSDFDFFIVSDKLYNKGVKMGAKGANGALTMSDTNKFPELKRVGEELSHELGRESSVKVFSSEGYRKVAQQTDVLR